MSTEVTAIATRPMADVQPAEMSIEAIVAQTQKIQQCMKLIMKKDEHYGIIPGTGTADRPAKPTLLKPGAEKLCLLFRLDPEYDVIKSEETPARISYMVRCSLFHIPTANRIASGLGSCNSREDKYVRAANKKCPACGKETIIKGKEEYGGGWLCFGKKGGCGAKFKTGDETIEKQDNGIKDPADLANTILKMACKRALVAAVLNGTAASDFFTQDLEDLTEKAADLTPVTPPKESADAPKDSKTSGGGRDTSRVAEGDSSFPTRAGRGPEEPALTKPALAPSIKHDGTMANHKQIALLHILRTKAGIPECDGKCAKEKPKVSKWGKEVMTTVRCAYHTQLAAFRDCDGNRITTSKDLSESQISNLLDRYQAKIDKQEVRAAQHPEMAEAPKPTDDELSELRSALDEKGDERLMNTVCDVFRVPTIADLPKHEVHAAFALVAAWGTPHFDAVLAQVCP